MKRISFGLTTIACGLALLVPAARSLQKTSSPPPSTSKTGQTKNQNSGSVFDQTKEESPEVLVPAATQIRVEISTTPDNKLEAKVAFPVRVDSATPIPALSKATVRIVSRGTAVDPNTGSIKGAYLVELTAITVGEITYKVQAETAPLAYPETVFSLRKPILR
jgi:hypothetical protein